MEDEKMYCYQITFFFILCRSLITAIFILFEKSLQVENFGSESVIRFREPQKFARKIRFKSEVLPEVHFISHKRLASNREICFKSKNFASDIA